MKIQKLYKDFKKSINWRNAIIIYCMLLMMNFFNKDFSILSTLLISVSYFVVIILIYIRQKYIEKNMYKEKTGILAGCFDIIHPGYIYMFEEAKNNCDKLIVLLQSDPTIDRPEKAKPILSLDERIKILESIKYIDEIIIYDTEKELYDLLKKIKPDVRFLGDDYIGKEINGGDLNIKISYINRNHGWSSTKYKQLIFDELYNKNIEQNGKNNDIYSAYIIMFDKPDLNNNIFLKSSISLENFQKMKDQGKISNFEIDDIGVKIYVNKKK